MSNIICIYHGNCADGFGAAWAVRNALGGGIEFFPGIYQESPPDVTGKDVILVDFSYKKKVIEEMALTARSILIIDHHKSAFEDLKGYKEAALCWYDYRAEVRKSTSSIIRVHFDMSRSGAVLAWNFFNIPEDAPQLLLHIEDRDLWKFDIAGTREISSDLFSHQYDFGVWDGLMAGNLEDMRSDGKAIERAHQKNVREFIAVAKHIVNIGGHEVPCLNAPYFYASDAGHIMCKDQPFAACYYDTADGRVFSLRSSDEGMDVSLIASQYGGGGHRNAAGFTVDHEHPLATPFCK